MTVEKARALRAVIKNHKFIYSPLKILSEIIQNPTTITGDWKQGRFCLLEMPLGNQGYERITPDLDMKSMVRSSFLVMTIRRTLEGRLGAKIVRGRWCPQCHSYCCHYGEHSPGFIQHRWHVQPYCKETLVSSRGLNRIEIKAIY